MSITVIVSFQTTNFDKWKAMFDGIENLRAEAGITTKVYRKIDAPNHVHIIGTAPSNEVVEEFFRAQNDKKSKLVV